MIMITIYLVDCCLNALYIVIENLLSLCVSKKIKKIKDCCLYTKIYYDFI